MGIVEFLEARIAEDEAVARKVVSDGTWTSGSTYGGFVSVEATTWTVTSGLYREDLYREDADHIARYDPARILREIAAKRAVVVEHKLVPAKNVWGNSTGGFGCELCDSTPDLDLGGIEIERSNGCKTLRTLAVIFSDHPDFSEGWRP